ncbi:HEAT repeat domain-containing protein [Fulvivirgaceae bacterium BMA10]|uniref:HEAT repeat domain-containing protein n=1 Tax=Splendidivirga corallicola TaxID=3051826 RepID=A0ABT8KM28_9BACT|nr:HEAT repeat domain-containing protein [Fulvivirgaceae bacterium BMA10]
MKDRDIKELLIDLIDGNLTDEEKVVLKERIASDKNIQREYEELKEILGTIDEQVEAEPEESLRLDFLDMLESELDELEKALEEPNDSKVKVIGLRLTTPLQIAAAVALLIIGGLAGIWFMKSNTEDAELAIIRKEMEVTKQLVMASLKNQSSASQRIEAVNASYELSQFDDEITDALINTMNHDENTNVRIAAIEALSKFSNEEKVRKALIASLGVQKNPLVQITLINLMVQMKEDRAVKELENLVKDSETIQTVKDEAQMGIIKLS